jgi:hypothetical protein
MGVFFFVPGRTITDGLIDAYKIISAAKSPDEKTHWCVIFRIARNDFWRKPRPVPSIRSQQFANVGTKKPHAVLFGVSLVTSLTITDERARDMRKFGTCTEFVTPAEAGAHITPTTLRTLP